MATIDMLQELGHEGVTACNAASAIAIAERNPPDAMLTDVNLPDMDGQKLAEEMRRRIPGLPVVFATGYRLTIPGDVTAAGPTTVLSKPFLMRELAEALRRVLSKEPA